MDETLVSESAARPRDPQTALGGVVQPCSNVHARVTVTTGCCVRPVAGQVPELLCPFRWVAASFLVLEAEGQGRGQWGVVLSGPWTGGLLLWLLFQIDLTSFGWLEPSSLHTGAEGLQLGVGTPAESRLCTGADRPLGDRCRRFCPHHGVAGVPSSRVPAPPGFLCLV